MAKKITAASVTVSAGADQRKMNIDKQRKDMILKCNHLRFKIEIHTSRESDGYTEHH